jgi:crotonobetainyl-CoA:carnitine CoA-transferase CaiB-like acyl-CoA transferase
LCALIGRPDLTNDPRFVSLASRKRNEDELEREVTNWTSQMTAEAVQERLIAAGIAAHVVSDARDLSNDPQLHHRNHWVTVPHATLGDLVVESTRFKLSRTPGRTLSAAPSIGQHAFAVLSQFAGYSADELADFAAAGVLQ